MLLVFLICIELIILRNRHMLIFSWVLQGSINVLE